MAIIMAMTIKKTQIQNMWAVNIYVDNQAAIQAAANSGQQSGQYLLKDIIQGIDKLQEAGIQVEIH